jgi:hypothetical protein
LTTNSIYCDLYFDGAWHLTYQLAICRMRFQSLVFGRYGLAKHKSGLVALLLLKEFLWVDFENVKSLCSTGSVVEFTATNGRAKIHEIRDDRGKLLRAKLGRTF